MEKMMGNKEKEVEKEKTKGCHECIHLRVCIFYRTIEKNRVLWLFFKDYEIHLFANICDNYKKDTNL